MKKYLFLPCNAAGFILLAAVLLPLSLVFALAAAGSVFAVTLGHNLRQWCACFGAIWRRGVLADFRKKGD